MLRNRKEELYSTTDKAVITVVRQFKPKHLVETANQENATPLEVVTFDPNPIRKKS